MGRLEQGAPAPRKVMTLFYLIDTSGSMSGTRITTVNRAMQETFPLLEEVARANDDAEIKVAIMQFSNGCSWVTPASGPVGLENIIYNPLDANGLTDFGAALTELDKKLSRNEFLNTMTGAYAPVILLLSDGGPTDTAVWPNALNELKKNKWFQHAIKIAIDIESGSDRSVLEKFTGNPEAILDAKNMDALKTMIYKVSVRASEFQSHSKESGDTITTAEEDAGNIVKQVNGEINDDNSGTVGDDKNAYGEWGEGW